MITKEVFEEQKALSDRWKEMYYEKKSEADQLTNNWNELEEIVEKGMNSKNYIDGYESVIYEEIYDKMKEIKGDNNEINSRNQTN